MEYTNKSMEKQYTLLETIVDRAVASYNTLGGEEGIREMDMGNKKDVDALDAMLYRLMHVYGALIKMANILICKATGQVKYNEGAGLHFLRSLGIIKSRLLDHILDTRPMRDVMAHSYEGGDRDSIVYLMESSCGELFEVADELLAAYNSYD